MKNEHYSWWSSCSQVFLHYFQKDTVITVHFYGNTHHILSRCATTAKVIILWWCYSLKTSSILKRYYLIFRDKNNLIKNIIWKTLWNVSESAKMCPQKTQFYYVALPLFGASLKICQNPLLHPSGWCWLIATLQQAMHTQKNLLSPCLWKKRIYFYALFPHRSETILKWNRSSRRKGWLKQLLQDRFY